MNKLIVSLILLTSFGAVVGMEHPEKTVTFRNDQGQTLEIPTQIVVKSPLLQSAAHNNLLNSIGTHGPKEVSLPELQDFNLIKTCLEYARLTPEELKCEIEAAHVLDNMPHFIRVMDMCSKLAVPEVQTEIARVIAQQLYNPKNRCMAFKNKTFNSLIIPHSVSAILAQEIVKPAKQYWMTQIAGLPHLEKLTAQDQLNLYITPYQALLLLDSGEHRTKSVPFSFTPGQENALFKAFSPLARPTQIERLSFAWKELPTSYKCTLGAVSTAAVCGAGYAAYVWLSTKTGTK